MKYFLLAVLLSFTFSLAGENKKEYARGVLGIYKCKGKKPKKICITDFQDIKPDGFSIPDGGGAAFYTEKGFAPNGYDFEKPTKCTIEIDYHTICKLELFNACAD